MSAPGTKKQRRHVLIFPTTLSNTLHGLVGPPRKNPSFFPGYSVAARRLSRVELGGSIPPVADQKEGEHERR